MKKTIKVFKTFVCALLLIVGFFLVFGECETMEQQIINFVIGMVAILLDTYIWQWWKMDKYYDKFLED